MYKKLRLIETGRKLTIASERYRCGPIAKSYLLLTPERAQRSQVRAYCSEASNAYQVGMAGTYVFADITT